MCYRCISVWIDVFICLLAGLFFAYVSPAPQMAVLLISCVVPTLQIVRAGVDEDIAFLLAGFNIILSEDRQEVVKIVVYYMWCVEGEWMLSHTDT